MAAISSLQAGLQAGFRAFERAAERQIQPQTGDAEPALVLSEILAARLQVRASASALRVSSDTFASLVDILA